MEQYSKVHVWIGTNFQSDEEYEQYFALDVAPEGDFDDPRYKVCGFCRDIGQLWYDEDFIGIVPRLDHEVDLDELLQEAAVDADDLSKVKEQCIQQGIHTANALVWYADAELVISQPYKDHYNGLHYIGMFQGD